jgi:CO/xanthine dehydrogenase Mo-binding subunit
MEGCSQCCVYYNNYDYACRYTDDIPHIDGELHAGLVMSTRPHANITVDYSEAIKMEGVTAYVGAPDIPGSNFIGKYSRTSLLRAILRPYSRNLLIKEVTSLTLSACARVSSVCLLLS